MSKPLSGPHQKFAEGIASGLNQTEAYAAAYPKCTLATARANGSDLLTNTDIAAEIARLREEAKKLPGSCTLTLAEKLDFLASITKTAVGSIDQNSHLCQEYTDEVSEYGAKKKFKMPCKLRALELHAKLSGELSDKTAPDTNIEINVIIGT